MSEGEPGVDMPIVVGSPNFRPGPEVEREVLAGRPTAARMADAVVRRKRLLSALAQWRDRAFNCTQTNMAEKLGCAQPDVSRLELGKVDPKVSTLERYAAALGANLFWQVVDDAGIAVVPDFTWSADVQFARQNENLMSIPTADIRDVAQRLARILESRDPLEFLVHLYAPDAALHLPGGTVVHSSPHILEYRAHWSTAFDDAVWSFEEDPIVEGRVVVISGTFRGVPTRGLHELGLDPHQLLEHGQLGRESIAFAFDERLVVNDDGGIIDDRWLFDRADILEQLQAIPAYA